jgi:DUF1009 family protein
MAGETAEEGTLAIVAGRDALPRLIAEARLEARQPYLVIAFHGAAPDWIEAHPHEVHEFERPGRLFQALRRAGCDRLVFAGSLERPRLRPWRADARAAGLVARARSLMAGGDDALLAAVAGLFEEEGFAVVGAQDCLPGLVAEPGVLGRRAPGRGARCDAALGARILGVLGPFDVGQAVVVVDGRCLGVEAAEGTDGLLARVGDLAPGGGVLVKMAKPGQDRRFDLPAIGPRTVEAAARAGLGGIAVEAGGVLVLERAATIAAADGARLFLWSAAPDELAG